MVANQRKTGIALSYLCQMVQILTGLLYTPIMIRMLGQREYGIYQLSYSIISYLGLLNFGFNASYLRFYSREKANADDDAVYKLNGMFMTVFLVLSAIVVICGSIIISDIRVVLGTGYSESDYLRMTILMIIMLLTMALSFPGSVFSCIIISQERFVFNKALLLIQSILNPFVTLPLLMLGYGSIAMASVSLSLTLLTLIVNAYYCHRILKTQFKFKGFRLGLLKEMWIFTFFIFLNQVIDQINWSVDKFLLGRFSGAKPVAVYSVSSQINLIYLQLSTSVSSVFAPEINRIVAETDDNTKLSELFIKIGRIQFMIMSLVLWGLVFFGRSFIRFWAGAEYTESYQVTLLLTIPVTIPLVQNIGIEIQRAKNKHKVRSWVYFCIAIANIAVSIPLVKVYGPTGAAVGTALSLVVGNGIFMNWYYYKALNIDIPLFWKNMIDFIPAILVSSIIGIVYNVFINQESMIFLIVFIAIYSVAYSGILYITGMNSSEKRIVMRLKNKANGSV